ncbi:DUF4158 domain-containing protein [Nonomuraea monospora]|uniref:DUF4158 domain-containing protein n=1 Tax=Nonomuraea monospora TaxID=568818 RepID=UPI003CD087CB
MRNVSGSLRSGHDQWAGSTIEYHRSQVRQFHGFRQPTVADEEKLIFWLAGEICPVETARERLRAALLARCREERLEPPAAKRIERLAGAAEAMFEREFTATTVQRLPAAAVTALEDLITVPDPVPEGEEEGGEGRRGAAQLLAGAEGGPGAAAAGDAAGRDRQAGAGQGDRAAGDAVRGDLGEGRGGVAGAGDAHVPPPTSPPRRSRSG